MFRLCVTYQHKVCAGVGAHADLASRKHEEYGDQEEEEEEEMEGNGDGASTGRVKRPV